MSSADDSTGPSADPQESPVIRVDFELQQHDAGRTVGSVRVFGLRSISQINADVLLHALSAMQTRAVAAPPEQRRLQDVQPSAAALAAQRENRRLGRVFAARIRHAVSAGVERRAVVDEIAAEYGRRASEIEILVRHHGRARARRAERFRSARLQRLKTDGLSNRQIAEHLRVTPQHVGRLLSDLRSGDMQ